jgi:hypothetical protein
MPGSVYWINCKLLKAFLEQQQGKAAGSREIRLNLYLDKAEIIHKDSSSGRSSYSTLSPAKLLDQFYLY